MRPTLLPILLSLLVLPAPPGAAQEGEAVEETAGETVDRQGRVPPEEAEDPLSTVEEILADEASMLEGDYSYDPSGRRDPFVPLMGGPRPDGPGPCTPRNDEDPSCLLIDQLKITGIYQVPEGPVAQVESPDRARSYLIREGDQLRDGSVTEITSNEVFFMKLVDDPFSIKPTREIKKVLNPEPIG